MNKKTSIYLSQTYNNMFSNLRGDDLLELLTVVENMSFDYRKKLLFDEDITFGTEVEYERLSRSRVTRFINYDYPDWTSKTDATCNFGGEIASRILTNDEESWQELYHVCAYLRNKMADMYHNASSHVHVSNKPLLDLLLMKQFLKFYMIYEPILFRFACGEISRPRKTLLTHAKPVAHKLYYNLEAINRAEALYLMIPTLERECAINFGTGIDTIEFRLYNGSRFATVKQNNINTSVNMILAPQRGLIDEEYLDYRLKKGILTPDIYYDAYFEINLSDVLKFVDMNFNNNLDKVYFLKQYIKTFKHKGKMHVPEEKDKRILRKF